MKWTIKFLIILFVVSGGMMHPLKSQISMYRYARDLTALGGGSFQFWKAADNKISQFSFPVNFVYPVSSRLRLDMMTSPALSSLQTNSSYGLNGLTDTRLRGSYLLNDNALVTFGVNLPTGKSALKTEEVAVSSTLALHALDFRVPNYGQGTDFQLGVATAFPVGNMVLGAGAGYLLKGGYQPYSNFDMSYQPGNELNFTAGLNIPLGERRKMLFDMIYTLYGVDKINGTKSFQSGNKLVLQALTYQTSAAWHWQLLVRDRLKSKNKIGEVNLVDERRNSNGNELEISFTAIRKPQQPMRWKGIVKTRLYSNNGYGWGGATVFGLGGGFDRQLSDALALNFQTVYYMGKLNTGSDSVSLMGLEIGALLRYTF